MISSDNAIQLVFVMAMQRVSCLSINQIFKYYSNDLHASQGWRKWNAFRIPKVEWHAIPVHFPFTWDTAYVHASKVTALQG